MNLQDFTIINYYKARQKIVFMMHYHLQIYNMWDKRHIKDKIHILINVDFIFYTY